MALDNLQDLVRAFEDFDVATRDARDLANKCRDFKDGTQWTADELAELDGRGQPVVTSNRIAPRVDFLCGNQVRTRTVPRAMARTPIHDDSADAITDAIRFAFDEADEPAAMSSAYDNYVVEGLAALEVCVEVDGEDIAINVDHLPWDTVWYDPHARRLDYYDARYIGTVKYMYLDDAVEIWPDSEDELVRAVADTGNFASSSDTHEDKPQMSVWYDGPGRRVRVAQLYYRRLVRMPTGGFKRDWYSCIYTRDTFLEEPALSPYVDDRGRSLCPILLQACFKDRDNQVYGPTKHLISPQEELNKRRSKALHLVSMRQTAARRGAIDDPEELRAQLARPDGHVDVNGNLGEAFMILPTGDMAQAQFELLQQSQADIDQAGPSATLLGKDPRSQSGIAIQRQQTSGFIEMERPNAGFRSLENRVAEQTYFRIRQFWTGDMWVRVTDDPKNVRFVRLNQPITHRDLLLAEAKNKGVEVPPEVLANPALNEVANIANDVTRMMVDIKLDQAPNVVNASEDQFAQLIDVAGKGVPIPPDILIEASSLRNKQELLDRIRGSQEQQAQQAQMAQQQQQMQAQAQALALQRAMLENRRTAADAASKEADAGKTAIEAQAMAVDAHRDSFIKGYGADIAPQGGRV